MLMPAATHLKDQMHEPLSSRAICLLARKPVAAPRRYRCALSGGETPQAVYRLLANCPYLTRLPWPTVHFFWAMNAVCRPISPISNYRQAQLALLNHIAVPPANIHRIPGRAGTGCGWRQDYTEAT